MESAASRFTAFSWLLALALLLHQLWWGLPAVLSAHGVVAGCALAVLARPSSVRRLVVLLAAEAVAVLAGLPNLGDHTLLVFVTAGSTLAYVLARVARTRRLPEPGVLFAAMTPLLRGQLLVLYGAAALAKLNAGFLDPAISCATPMAGPLPPSVAIGATIAIEASLPVLLVVRRTRTTGLMLGVAFHAALAVAGNVPFTALVLALYVAWLPGVPRLPALSPRAVALAAGGWLIGAQSALAPGAQGGVVRAATILVTLAAAGAVLQATRRPDRGPVTARVLHPAMAVGLLLVVSNAASPYVGLKTSTTFTMFSNLQTEPGHWNHLLVPEAVRVFGAQDHLVRIAATNDRRLDGRRRAGRIMVRAGLERYLRAHPRSWARVRGGEVTLRAASLPGSALLDRVAHFQDVRPGARGRC